MIFRIIVAIIVSVFPAAILFYIYSEITEKFINRCEYAANINLLVFVILYSLSLWMFLSDMNNKYPIKRIRSGQGCCSHNGGVCACSNNRTICCNGTRSMCDCVEY